MFKLTPENYYSANASWHYMSTSLFKSFEKCEARTLASLKGEWKEAIKDSSQPDPLIMGNYIHSFFQSKEAHESFLKKPETIKDVYKYGNPEKEMKKGYRVLANCMIQTLQADDMFKYFYAPGEKEVIVTGKIGGYWWKGKIDSLCLDKGYFCDLKTVDDIHKGHWNAEEHRYVPFIQDREYNLQMAIYRELIRQTFNVDCQPFIFAVSKQTPPDKMAIDFSSPDGTDAYQMQEQMDKLKELQPHFWKVMTGEEKPEHCGKCDYCRETKMLNGFVHASEIEV